MSHRPASTPPDLIAWAAGLFEGEGSLFLSTSRKPDRPNPYVRPRMQMSSTDLDVLERFHAVVSVGRIYGPYMKQAPARLPRWDWQVGSVKNCAPLVAAFWPYLGERRRAKAIEIGLEPVAPLALVIGS